MIAPPKSILRVGFIKRTMSSTMTLVKYGLIGAFGLLITGWAGQSYVWLWYQRANPDVGAVSTGTGFELVIAGLFIVGITVAFTAFSTGFIKARASGKQF